MKSKEFYFLTWVAFILAFSFTLVAIWNTEWELVEKGFYTCIIGWVTFSAFTLVKVLRDKADGIKVSTEYVFLTWASIVASFGIGFVAVWNTEWVLVEKGYYSMGLMFITYASFALSKEIRDRQSLQTDKVKKSVTNLSDGIKEKK